VARGEFSARERGARSSHQRVADPVGSDSRLAVEIRLEGEKAEAAHEAAAHQIHTPGPPGPELRADEIDVLHAAAMQGARQAEMKAGEVGEDGQRRTAADGFGAQAAHGAAQRGNFARDLENAGHAHFGAIHDDFDAGFAHARAAHAEEVNIGALAERASQLRGVHIAGSFAGGDQEFGWGHGNCTSGAEAQVFHVAECRG